MRKQKSTAKQNNERKKKIHHNINKIYINKN